MKYRFLPAVLLLLPASLVLAADDYPSLPTAEEIVARMGSRDLQRQVSIEGYAGMRRYVLETLENGGGLTVPGAFNKFSVFAQRLIPRRLVPRMVAKVSRA